MRPLPFLRRWGAFFGGIWRRILRGKFGSVLFFSTLQILCSYNWDWRVIMQHHQFCGKQSNFLPLLKHFSWAFLHVNFKHQNTLTKSLPTLSPKYSQTKRDGRDALPLQMCPCLEESPPETMATTLAVPIYPSSQEIGEPWCTPTRSLLQEAEPEAPLQLHPNMFQPQTMLQPWMEPQESRSVTSLIISICCCSKLPAFVET